MCPRDLRHAEPDTTRSWPVPSFLQLGGVQLCVASRPPGGQKPACPVSAASYQLNTDRRHPASGETPASLSCVLLGLLEPEPEL